MKFMKWQKGSVSQLLITHIKGAVSQITDRETAAKLSERKIIAQNIRRKY